ncbi:MAG TPA: hypothetical protein V6D20_15915, partial [Candidatus Obscuribacterales bacterium]
LIGQKNQALSPRENKTFSLSRTQVKLRVMAEVLRFQYVERNLSLFFCFLIVVELTLMQLHIEMV